MKINKVSIKNFRKLADIEFSLKKNISVVVGPNAAGKSSIFESIRLAKAVLFPRMQDELRNVLIHLGATSAHFYNGQLQYDFSALAGDVTKPVNIALTLTFTASEIETLKRCNTQIARNLVSAQLGRSFDDPTYDLRAYFSTNVGQQAQLEASAHVEEALASLKPDAPFVTSIEITATQISTSGAIINLFVSAVERNLTPDKAIFSYFPADRSLPQGEIAIQIGPQDFKAQTDSHFATATTKYGRLKQSVINQTLLGAMEGISIESEFNKIFTTFLPGKQFIGLSQKPSGLLAVLVKDITSGKIFDIDSLSSGEKGLVLSFLLFRNAITEGSIILVDELELHLNAAVCKKILPYLAKEIVGVTDSQFIVSTHSPELMRDAFEHDDAELFHLRSDTDISPVLPQDKIEVLEIVRRLGVSTESALTSKALMFVEGDSDVAILEAAFPSDLVGVQSRGLNGRPEVEKSIRDLQAAEAKGLLREPQGFLFDNDRQPTQFKSSNLVKIAQLNRYCIENYLLDEEVLYDKIQKSAKRPPDSRGTFSRHIKELAIAQLERVILNDLINEYRSITVAIKAKELKNKSVTDIANLQLQKFNEAADQLRVLTSKADWETDFYTKFDARRGELQPQWENDWKSLCSGKLLFEDLQRHYEIGVDLLKFKTALAEELGRQNKDDILALRSTVTSLIS